MLPGWIALFPVLESIAFSEECAEKLGANTLEVFAHELAAGVPTLKTITFGSEIKKIRRDTY